MVQEIAGLSALVDEPAFVEIAINGLEDGDAPTHLLDRHALRERELERIVQVGDDLRCPRLDEAGRMDAVLRSVGVTRVRRDESSWIAVVVHMT